MSRSSRLRSVSLLAMLGLLTLAPGCYETPKPSCAFLCGATDSACPGGYFCATDGWCKLDGVADSLACDGIVLDAAVIDAPAIDAPAIDAPAIDAPAIDAPELDAAIDAAPPVDAPTDASLDASAPMLVVITASPLQFGTIVQTQSATQTITLRNRGGSITSALTVGVTGSAAFALVAGATDTCTGQTLAPATTCTFDVRYAPTGVGAAAGVASAMATAGGSVSINLAGDSVAALAAPATVGLGSVTVGQMASMAVTFTNQGAVSTGTITTTPPTGAFTITADTCQGAAVIAAGTCAVTVEFAPTAAGAQTATVTVDATPGGPRTVMLTGTGL